MACWAFPIYSQTFVYQELTQLVRKGFSVRFLYAHQESRARLPGSFSCLWRVRRCLFLHEAVCEREYAYFMQRVPEKVELLLELLAAASGLDRETVRRHRHFRQALVFARMVEAYRPDYLHSYFFYEGTLFALVASYLLGIPRGVSCYADHMLKDYDLKVVPLHLKQCEVVVATSQRIKQELTQLAPGADARRIIVKPNAVDLSQFRPKAGVVRANGRPFNLVCACRIEPKKGLVYLVEAMAILRQRGCPVELHLLGAPDDNPVSQGYAQELDALIAQRGLREVVHREGRKTGAEVRAFFSRSDLFVAPFIETDTGDKDGIPTVLLEAMAAGLPVVATDAGSITEVIDDEQDGILVQQRDPAALAEAIGRMLGDEPARATFARCAVEKVRTHFDVSVCEPRFHQRIMDVWQRRPLCPPQGLLANWKRPTVSVIVPFLNANKFLWEAIESVLLQTYEDWELVLIDDGSSDGGSEMARTLAARFPGKVVYLEHEGHQNRGTAASRNAGIRRSSGSYVAPLDADDVWFSTKLEEQVALLTAHPETGMVYGASEYWWGWSGQPEDRARDYVPDFGIPVEQLYLPPMLLPLLHPFGKGTPGPPSDILLRRDVVEQVGGFVEDFRGVYQLYEDQFFLTKVYLHAPVWVSSRCWDKYRLHPDSCSAIVAREGCYDAVRRRFLERFEAYLKKHAIADESVHRALEDALRPFRVYDRTEAAIPVGQVRWGDLRRVKPVERYWGLKRGKPIDRYYIEQFLQEHADAICGRAIEIEDTAYTRQFGGARVTSRDALAVREGYPEATIIADLTQADVIQSDQFDCFILTQTLQLIYDTQAALRTVHRILKPGGVVLATFPGITQLGDKHWTESWYWSFTQASTRRLFGDVFGPDRVQVAGFGNVLVATAFLHGMTVGEVTPEELAVRDPEYDLIVGVRAVKAPGRE